MTNQTTTTVAIVGLAIVSFAFGFILGNMTADGESETATVLREGMQNTKEAISGNDENTRQTDVENGSEVAFTISGENLTDSQKAMLSSMGIDSAQINVTYNMIACAEAEIGASRVEEIKNGATPSFSEGLKLVACYE